MLIEIYTILYSTRFSKYFYVLCKLCYKLIHILEEILKIVTIFYT